MAIKNKVEKEPTCGIIMPISSIDNCSSEHWVDVLGIIMDVCKTYDFVSNLVSESDEIGVIHNRIIENIYSSDIVICDVSCNNANVMFELGMRLAFDKPTIIIKDDMTDYSFDTSLIEHLEYPRDLRFTSINKFKDNLGKKLKATYEKAVSDPSYSTFLKNFGKYKIAHLEEREITSNAFILNAIEELQSDIRVIKNITIHENSEVRSRFPKTRELINKEISKEEKYFFRQHVQDFIKTNNLSTRPKDLQMELPVMIKELEKNEDLRKIAGSTVNFRKLVNESLF